MEEIKFIANIEKQIAEETDITKEIKIIEKRLEDKTDIIMQDILNVYEGDKDKVYNMLIIDEIVKKPKYITVLLKGQTYRVFKSYYAKFPSSFAIIPLPKTILENRIWSALGKISKDIKLYKQVKNFYWKVKKTIYYKKIERYYKHFLLFENKIKEKNLCISSLTKKPQQTK